MGRKEDLIKKSKMGRWKARIGAQNMNSSSFFIVGEAKYKVAGFPTTPSSRLWRPRAQSPVPEPSCPHLPLADVSPPWAVA